MLGRKVCLIGEFAVGKTSLFNRLVYNRFSPTYLSTLGVRIQRKTTDHAALALLLWDIEGGREGATPHADYLGGAGAIVLVCDLTRPRTIDRLPLYAAQARLACPRALIVIAANKADCSAADAPTIAAAQNMAAQLDAPLAITSAVDGSGVHALFTLVSQRLAPQAAAA